MSLHPRKTKFMLITTRHKRQNMYETSNSRIGKVLIEQVNSHKKLGLIIYNTLKWSSHVSNMCPKLQRNYQFSKIKHVLDMHTRKLLFCGHIQSILDYVSIMWDSASGSILKPLSGIYRHSRKIIKLQSSSLLTSN